MEMFRIDSDNIADVFFASLLFLGGIYFSLIYVSEINVGRAFVILILFALSVWLWNRAAKIAKQKGGKKQK